jgi:hypothetical protein
VKLPRVVAFAKWFVQKRRLLLNVQKAMSDEKKRTEEEKLADQITKMTLRQFLAEFMDGKTEGSFHTTGYTWTRYYLSSSSATSRFIDIALEAAGEAEDEELQLFFKQCLLQDDDPDCNGVFDTEKWPALQHGPALNVQLESILKIQRLRASMRQLEELEYTYGEFVHPNYWK